jgi:mannose-6-phosphate isomerase-like protein (cupin superfamily)
MADVTVKKISEMESLHNGGFVRARAEMGVKSFGMQVENFPPGFTEYPEHDHVADAPDNQEEVYIVLSGKAILKVGAETFDLEPGIMARVGAGEKRRIVTTDQPVQILCLGGTPGQAYEVPSWSELGAPGPGE